MIFFVDLFQPHGIDMQAGEQKLLALAYSTLYNTAITWLHHLLAPFMQKQHAVIIIPSRLATTHTSLLWILTDPWTLQNKAIFVPSFRLQLVKCLVIVIYFFETEMRNAVIIYYELLLYSCSTGKSGSQIIGATLMSKLRS